MRRIHRDIVSVLLLSKDGLLLQGKKNPKDGGVYSHAWHIPGGGIESGEDQLIALQRETLEETGIDVSAYAAEQIDIDYGESEKTLKDTGERVICEMTFNVYRVCIDDREAVDIPVTLGDDLVEFRWIRPQDLKKEELTPPSVKLFTKLGYLSAS